MPTPREESEFSEYIGVKASPDLLERVEAAAARDGRTVSSWVRQALRRRLDAEDRLREGAATPSQ